MRPKAYIASALKAPPDPRIRPGLKLRRPAQGDPGAADRDSRNTRGTRALRVHRPAAAAQDLRALNGGMFSRPSLFMLVISAIGRGAARPTSSL
jgi:hypothetical protein